MKFQPALVWHLARKDWKLFLADRQAALLCFAVPIVLASVFGAVFHRPEGASMPRLPLVLVCEDNSAFTNRVIQTLRNNSELNVGVVSRERAFRWLEGQTSGVVMILPDGFGERTEARPRVQVCTQPGSEYQGRWAEGVLTEAYLKQAAAEWMGDRAASFELPFTVQHEHLPGSGSLSVHAYSHSFCGMTLQYLLFWGMDSGLLLLREKRRGLWQRVRAAPLGLETVLAGKVLSTGVIALAQIGVTFGFGMMVFGVRVSGSLAGFGLLAVMAALLSAATGLLVAALGGNEARARSLSIIAILTLSLLGGLWLPFALLPQWAQRLAAAVPTTWAAKGFEGVTWRGMGWTGAWPCALMVAAFSLVFLAVALWRLCWSEARLVCKGES
jgi:ABC-2 type transport system permease protein